MELVQIFNSVSNKLLKVSVPGDVAERCRTDSEFVHDLFNQINHSLQENNVENVGAEREPEKNTIFKTFQENDNPISRDSIWSEISQELASQGISKSAQDCSNKWISLLRTHKFCDFESSSEDDDEIHNNLQIKAEVKEPAERDFWTNSQTVKFLKTYHLHKTHRKKYNEKQFWQIVSDELTKDGVFKSWEKCSIKWKNLYRTYKKNLTRNATNSKRFLFFTEMDEILNKVPNIEFKMGISMEISGPENNQSKEDLEVAENAVTNSEDQDKSQNELSEENNQIIASIDPNLSAFWSREETSKLIEVYRKYKHVFEKSPSMPIWDKISTELSRKGVYKDAIKCRNKWKNLRRDYRTCTKETVAKTKFPFAREMKDIMGEQFLIGNEMGDANETDTYEEIIIETEFDSWSKTETSALIETYNKYKNSFNEDRLFVWEQISTELNLKKIYRTPENCQKKWKNLFKSYCSRKHKPDKRKFEFYSEIDSILKNEGFGKESRTSHKENCECYERRIEERSRRHKERMDLMKRKLDLEERKLLAFEEYLKHLRAEKGG
ncbi:hypothetical protein JTB14_022856 [Gonioctena quinquepunctata]|nr:hypothetical protein JTB14_022856 [Gonioctena quinquepunctata]